MIVPGSQLTAPLTLSTQVVIVGSGAGGSLVAERLARAGKDVVVLEAGPYVPGEQMNQREREMMRLLYWEAGMRATEDGGMGVLHGRGLGGSTVVNYLDCFRTPPRVLNHWVEARGLPQLTPEKMAPRFDRIFDILGVQKLPESGLNPNNRKLMEGGRALGWYGDTFHRNANQCYGSGFCDLGCAYNAKQSAAITFIPLAMASGARVYTEVRVDSVILEAGRAVGVAGMALDADRKPIQAVTVRAETVIVSCGAIESPHLLLRSGVSNPSGQLGRNLYLHPSCPVVGHFPGERIANYEGIKQGYYVGEFSDGLMGHPDDFLLEGIGAPPGLASTVFSGLGAERQATFKHLNEYAVVGVLLRDHDSGTVTAGAGRPVIDYALSKADGLRMQRGVVAAARALLAAGATVSLTSHNPARILRRESDFQRVWDTPLDPGAMAMFSFHQMGTCRMGDQRGRDVVNPEGRLWDVPGLYVADSSIFPESSGVNPQITVYGLADVVADGIAAR